MRASAFCAKPHQITTMKRLPAALCMGIAFACPSLDALATTWPKLNAGTPAQCSEALQIARIAFNSDAFLLYAPPEIPENFPSALVLQPEALDISNGNALVAAETVFDKLPIGGGGAPRNIFWQKSAVYGRRLVVVEEPMGWQGDMYSLSALDEKTRLDEFLSELRRDWRIPRFSPIMFNAWRPPLIFREKKSDQVWAIDVGPPYWILADWNVYAMEPSGVKRRCSVQFRPNVKKAILLLPKPVRELAQLLDRTMGQGRDEGTLRPTERLRLNVQHTWGNAALRPWVPGSGRYNTRDEIDAGLENWSKTGEAYREVYLAIKRQYPVAERSLARYYQHGFGQSAPDAAKLAAHVLDNAYRSHYVFPRQKGPADASVLPQNPWVGPRAR